METVHYTSDVRIKEADEKNEIFYALKFTYDKQGRRFGSGPYYSLCLPKEGETLVLHDSVISAEYLANSISHIRKTGDFNFSRIDMRMPQTIPEMERFDPLSYIVLFEEMSKKEKVLFSETLVKKK